MFERFAIFYCPPPDSAFAVAGAAWLGWDSNLGARVEQPLIDGVDMAALTQTPRKYGFHATLKAPFRLAAGRTTEELIATTKAVSQVTAPMTLTDLEMGDHHGFLALRPVGEVEALRALAAKFVCALDPFRAALRDDDIMRRRKAGLTARQDAQMLAWGYPFVFDDFHFHMTLSGEIGAKDSLRVLPLARRLVGRFAPQPFIVDAVTVMGQDGDGLFHQLSRAQLSG